MSSTYEKLRMVLAGFAASIALTVFSFLIPSISEASIITIDPGAYAEGADLSTVSPFVTLQSLDGPYGTYPITALTSSFSGARVFNGFSEIAWTQCVGRYECARGFGMAFHESPHWVSLSMTFTNMVLSDLSSIVWFAFDASGDFLASGGARTYGYQPGQFFALNIAVPDMMSLVVGGDLYPMPGEVDRLSFAFGVPGPSSLVLSFLGLTGIILLRSRRGIQRRSGPRNCSKTLQRFVY